MEVGRRQHFHGRHVRHGIAGDYYGQPMFATLRRHNELVRENNVDQDQLGTVVTILVLVLDLYLAVIVDLVLAGRYVAVCRYAGCAWRGGGYWGSIGRAYGERIATKG